MEEEKKFQLVEKGPCEKNKVRNSLLKKKDDKICKFISEFRCFYQNSNKRETFITMLLNEMDHTLNEAEKQVFINKWSPVAPFIFVGNTSQLHDIRNYLNSVNLSQINVECDQRLAENATPQSFAACGDAYTEPSFVDQESMADVDMFLYSMTQPTMNSDSDEMLLGDENLYLSRSMVPSNILRDLNEELCDQACDKLSNSSTDTTNTKNTFQSKSVDEEALIKTSFYQVLEVMQKVGNVLSVLTSIKTTLGLNIYEGVLKYYDVQQEPLLFHLAVNYERYENVLLMIHKDHLLDISQKNFFKISIFYFLLMINMDVLYQFLKFTKVMLLKESVQRICAQDKTFRAAITQKKQEMVGHSEQSRKKIEVIEQFCFGNI